MISVGAAWERASLWAGDRILTQRIFERFKDLAERLDLPYEVEVYPHYSGTDAMGMQIVAEGIPTMVLSIPLRYMHTPVEVISMKDIQRAGRLLAQFIAGLDTGFIANLRWDEETE